MHTSRVAIIGGGVAGVTCALYLAHSGVDVTLIEQAEFPVSGPPFCHLHAGGNLYPDIDLNQCVALLEQSIDFARLYPQVVDPRPTLIAIPRTCTYSPQEMSAKLIRLQDHYRRLVTKDSAKGVLGDPDEYFRLYDHSDLERVRHDASTHACLEGWVKEALGLIDCSRLRYPIALVQEYGLNLFRMAALAYYALSTHPRITLMLSTKAYKIEACGESYRIYCRNKQGEHTLVCDYLVNAAGFRSGIIDEMLGVSCKKLVEFKAAYIARFDMSEGKKLPEIIFHGKRGSATGMGQFTPYGGGYVQIHAMSTQATLYPNGLSGEPRHCNPRLAPSFIAKIEQSWEWSEVDKRTQNAIGHIARFMPDFAMARTGAIPLYGAQQIPGDDPSLRVGEVSFPQKRYARMEIVKVSSAPESARAILRKLYELKLLNSIVEPSAIWHDESKVAKLACSIAHQRGYPEEMARLYVHSAISEQ